VAEEGLLTAWTCTKSVVSMIEELPSMADALAAGAAVARVLEGGTLTLVKLLQCFELTSYL
jgi:hypothetical protein